eukprot:617090-Rhodomonas_salina.1
MRLAQVLAFHTPVPGPVLSRSAFSSPVPMPTNPVQLVPVLVLQERPVLPSVHSMPSILVLLFRVLVRREILALPAADLAHAPAIERVSL